jgi:hypothetical protein
MSAELTGLLRERKVLRIRADRKLVSKERSHIEVRTEVTEAHDRG